MGMVSDSMERKLRTGLAPTRLVIEDESARHAGHAGVMKEGHHHAGGSHHAEGETHFNVEIVSAAFEGKSRVARQRMVYDLLAEEMKDRVHALSLVTLTPAEAT